MTIDIDALERAFATTGRVVSGLRPDQLDAPTPCTEWKVRDVLNHVVGGTRMFATCARGQESSFDPFGFPEDVLTADVAKDYDAAAADALAAWRECGPDGTVKLTAGEMPALVALAINFCDVLMHGDDLARATQQDLQADPDLVEAAYNQLTAMLGDGSRGPGKPFALAVSVPESAPTLERLRGFMGRQPN